MNSTSSLLGIAASLLLGAAVAVAGSDGSVDVGSVPLFLLVAAIAYVVNWLVFVPSYLARTEHYFDLTGSLTYITVTCVALVLADDLDARAVLAGALVIVWAARLGSFLFRRVRRDRGDRRFDRIKADPLRFLMTWSLQGLWVLLTAGAALAIVTAEEREPFDVFAGVGLVVWLAGFALEVAADRQKRMFRADEANRDRYITTGLWAWSRHPNYFGEIVLWTGMAVMAVPILSGWRWVVMISPVFVVVLLTRVSGIPMLEHRARSQWGDEPAYRAYVEGTPVLVPRPPRR